MSRRVLVARLDSDGDVLLSGPAVRAVAASGAEVVLLCGPRGRAAAGLLPGVADLLTWTCPWIVPDPPPVRRDDVDELVAAVTARRVDEAVLLTSFHQSPLPTALLLRLAGVPRITGASTDYAGSLLDVRLRVGADPAAGAHLDTDLPEAEQALAIAAAAGYRLPPGDGGRLAVRRPPDTADLTGTAPYVVVHPGADAPSRRWPEHRCAEAVAGLAARGWRVVVTGGPAERALTARVAGRVGRDLGGRTDLARLAGVLAGARAVVVGNTGPAHLAAAVGTPVVSLFSPVVPAARWAPHGPHALLGDQGAACRGTRARSCPLPGHPCLAGVTGDDAVRAVERLVGPAPHPARDPAPVVSGAPGPAGAVR